MYIYIYIYMKIYKIIYNIYIYYGENNPPTHWDERVLVGHLAYLPTCILPFLLSSFLLYFLSTFLPTYVLSPFLLYFLSCEPPTPRGEVYLPPYPALETSPTRREALLEVAH